MKYRKCFFFFCKFSFEQCKKYSRMWLLRQAYTIKEHEGRHLIKKKISGVKKIFEYELDRNVYIGRGMMRNFYLFYEELKRLSSHKDSEIKSSFHKTEFFSHTWEHQLDLFWWMKKIDYFENLAVKSGSRPTCGSRSVFCASLYFITLLKITKKQKTKKQSKLTATTRNNQQTKVKDIKIISVRILENSPSISDEGF